VGFKIVENGGFHYPPYINSLIYLLNLLFPIMSTVLNRPFGAMVEYFFLNVYDNKIFPQKYEMKIKFRSNL